MDTRVKRMPNSKGMTIRIPEELLCEVRRARAVAESKENRTVSLNEIIIKALREYSGMVNAV